MALYTIQNSKTSQKRKKGIGKTAKNVGECRLRNGRLVHSSYRNRIQNHRATEQNTDAWN